MKPLKVVALAALAITVAVVSYASETAHFTPGLPSIRDFFVPEPGFYGIIYNWSYSSDQLNDRNGDEIAAVTIPIPPDGVTLDLALDLDVYVLSPGVMWCSNWKVLGAKYGAYTVFALANTSIGAALTTQTGTGRSIEESQFNLGDWFIQPVWLGWTREHWDVAFGYGFYAPIGKYDTESVTISNPITHEPLGTFTAEAADNIGLGFWTHQFQGTCGWYPWKDKRMAIAGTLTWEINGSKKDFDLTPGQNLALNWGISEYLPLTKDKNVLLEVGPAGYNSWQLTDDSGVDAMNPTVHDNVYGVGVQIGSIYVPWHVVLNFRYMYEYGATDRFQGQSLGLNLAISF